MKLRTRILVTYIGLAVIGIAGAGGFSSWLINSYLEAALAERQTAQLGLVSAIIQDKSLATLSWEERQSVLQQTANHLGVRLTVIRKDGRVVFDSEVPADSLWRLENHADRPEIIKAKTGALGFDRRKSNSVGTEFIYAASRISGPSLGEVDSAFVRTATPTEELDEADSRIFKIVCVAVCVAVIVTTIVSLYVSKRISQPVLNIVETVKKIKGGDVFRRITGRYPGEIGELATAVNDMAEKLASDIASLERLERVRSEFLGNVSHELRTPIFSLQGFLETLIDGAIDDPNVNREFLEKAHRHADRLNILLNDLIDISRIESGEMKMSFRYFSVAEFLREIVDEMAPVAGTKNLAMQFIPEFDASAKAYGDKSRLRQVMTNLIDNAIKYTEPGGTITCRVRPLKNQCEILVEDTGCGIPEEHLPRIFERFYRVDKDRSREVGGTGLGLAIAKHIVEAHGGTLLVTSEVGKGTTFSFNVKR